MSTLINEKAASYIIWKSGSDYYAQDGRTNTVDYKGTNAATVIQAAIDDLDNGRIFIKTGNYAISTGLTVAYNQNIQLIGEGMRNTILDSSGAGGVTDLLQVGGATDLLYGFYMSDIGFKGVTGTTDLFTLYNSRSSVIERCHFNQFKYGIHIDCLLGTDHQNYEHCIRNNYLNGPNQSSSLAGIHLDGFSDAKHVTTTTVANNYVHDVAVCLLTHYTSNSTIIGNAFEHSQINMDIDYYSDRNGFFKNSCETASVYDVRIENAGANCNYNYFYANDFWSTNKVSDGGWGNQFFQCAEWVTEQSGTGTILSGTTALADIDHGLSYTPDAKDFTIVFTENPTNDQGNWWISNIDSAHFDLNVRNNPGASNLDFAWSVSKKFG